MPAKQLYLPVPALLPESEEKQEQDDSKSKYEMDEIPTPYHASRDKIIANKFYEGNEDRNEEYEEI